MPPGILIFYAGGPQRNQVIFHVLPWFTLSVFISQETKRLIPREPILAIVSTYQSMTFPK